MQFYTILTLALSTFGVAAIPTPQDDTPANFKVATMTYEGPLRVNGPSVKLSGTVESIYSQILKLNPNFDSEKFPAIPGPTDTTLGDDDEIGGNNKTLDAARDKPFGLNCKCDGNRAPSGAKVYDGINYLLRLPGKCGIFSGPSVCTRVSCSHHNAIYACNDVSALLILQDVIIDTNK